jgi:hypothetical protein
MKKEELVMADVKRVETRLKEAEIEEMKQALL